MSKQINFRAPEYVVFELELLCMKMGIDKTTAIIWSINNMCKDHNITSEDVYKIMNKDK